MHPQAYQRLRHVLLFCRCDPFRVKPARGLVYRGRCPRLLYVSPAGIRGDRNTRDVCAMAFSTADVTLSGSSQPGCLVSGGVAPGYFINPLRGFAGIIHPRCPSHAQRLPSLPEPRARASGAALPTFAVTLGAPRCPRRMPCLWLPAKPSGHLLSRQIL